MSASTSVRSIGSQVWYVIRSASGALLALVDAHPVRAKQANRSDQIRFHSCSCWFPTGSGTGCSSLPALGLPRLIRHCHRAHYRTLELWNLSVANFYLLHGRGDDPSLAAADRQHCRMRVAEMATLGLLPGWTAGDCAWPLARACRDHESGTGIRRAYPIAQSFGVRNLAIVASRSTRSMGLDR